MVSTSGQRMPFFPKADVSLLSPEHTPLPPRPKTVGPIYDPDNVEKPIVAWTCHGEACYPAKTEAHAPASIPEQPTGAPSRYLRPHLARNERLRLSMLWYYTRDILDEPEFLSGLQEKACLAQESTGWEFVVIGILDVNVYIRLATVGLDLSILPRGETLCAHTVTQPPGSVFLLPNMMEDWRFRASPYVEQGGLTAYAGVPLRMLHDSGECVGLGSLCVASPVSQDPLSKPQQQTLARLADWIVADIVQCARARRQRERHRMSELVAAVQRETEDTLSEEPILRIVRAAYPNAAVRLQLSRGDRIETDGGRPVFSHDLENGLWEDTAYIDEFIATSNQQDPPSDKVVRFIAAQCDSMLGPSLLVVATTDFRQIFDDVDSWFVQTCAGMLSQRWQKRLLSEVTRAKEKFLRGVSHQLRTPIHGILGAAELLAEDLKMSNLSENACPGPDLVEVTRPSPSLDKAHLYLETISMAGRDLMSTVNSMITLNRWADIAMSDRQYAAHSIYDLEMELAKGISETISGDARYKASIFLDYDLPPGCDNLRIDLDLLRNSLLPLVINAIQNTLEGIVAITVSIRRDRTELVVDVEDTGHGIHPDDQQRIFELYEKVDEHSTGAGLGLTLAAKFATLLHGSIELVSSDIGRGSHFRATFRDVDYLPSPFEPALPPQLTTLPSKFHHMVSNSAGVPLSARLGKSLIRHGITPSETAENCIIIVDFVPDSEQRRLYLSNIPRSHVAICLIPASVERGSLEPTLDNVVYVTGPFLTSKIRLALQEAESILARIKASQRVVPRPREPVPSLPTTDETSSSDEGYGSMTVSPPLEGQLDRTLTDTADHISEILSPLLCQVDAVADSTPAASILAVPSNPARPRALLVDDNIVNLRILQMYCRKRGLPYCCAADGQQAVEVFSENQSLSAVGEVAPIQLILMDLQMPSCDGIEATRQIRLLERRAGEQPSVLFIVSGQDSAPDREAASSAGADDYLVKPVGMKLLDGGVKRYFPAFEAS